MAPEIVPGFRNYKTHLNDLRLIALNSRKHSLPKKATQRGCLRAGLSLVELIVVIFIIAILMGLLIPAVQAVRESARKTSCQNNLRQVGVALHSYHNSHESLPVGCIEWRSWNGPSHFRQFAWSATLLPYLEQQSLHSKIDWSLPYDAPENKLAAETNVMTYICPSESLDTVFAGHTSYGGIFGERILDSTPDDGVFLYDRAVRFDEIKDGLTHTLIVAEDVGGPDKQWINGRNVFVVAHGINDPAAWAGDNEIRSDHPNGAMVLFADGHSAFLSDSTDQQLLGRLVTRAGGEIVEHP